MIHFLIKPLFILSLLLISCTPQEDLYSSLEITYKAKTRGNSLSISYRKDTVYLKGSSIQKEIPLDPAAIRKLKKIISNIKLSEIHTLPAPSNNRFSDAAMIANFTIVLDNKIFISSDFDHGNPPAQLRKLYTILDKFIK
jgi:hypothetical protein